ncbi:MAG: hypothetical protein GY720_03805 [bacterium]|nr:hypothetical protein [bacterium]
MRRIVGAVVVCLLALGSVVNPITNTERQEPAQSIAASGLPELGPIKAITHIYVPDMDADADMCLWDAAGSMTGQWIHPSDISAAPGVQFVVASVNYTFTDFDVGGFTDESTISPNLIFLHAVDTGCDIATTGDLAATLTGTLTNGDTFSIDLLVP